MDDDVTRGLIGRRVCGGIELVFGVLLVLGTIQSFNIVSLLSALLIILTGVLGIVSHNRGLVIAYLVTGIICVILLLISTIFGVLAIVAYNDVYDLDSTTQAILVAAVVILALGLIVAVLGVIFACRPLCGQGAVPYQRHTSPNIVGPPGYNQGNTAYPVTLQGLPTNNYGNAAYPVTMEGPPTYNYGNTGYPVIMQGPPLQNYGNTTYPDTKQGPV